MNPLATCTYFPEEDVIIENQGLDPYYPEGFPKHIFRMGGCCNPLRIINTEGHVTLNLLPVYRYGHPRSNDTKISTNY